jgi:hypothetical protein
MLRRIIAFVVAAALMVVGGSASHSYFVQRAWSKAAGMAEGGAAASIPFTDRITWGAHDLIGMIVGYSALTSIALLAAFLLAGALARFSGGRTLVFAIAGAAAILVLFTILRMVLGTVGIFGARGALGLSGQMLAGLLAGVLFARLTPPRKAATLGTRQGVSIQP